MCFLSPFLSFLPFLNVSIFIEKYPNHMTLISLPLEEEEEDHEEGFEATRNYSEMKMFTGKSPKPLEEVNTKIYIGTEVNPKNVNINIQHFQQFF